MYIKYTTGEEEDNKEINSVRCAQELTIMKNKMCLRLDKPNALYTHAF